MEAGRERLARVLKNAPLARVVPRLAPETLHALIRHRGLDAAGDLVAAATPAQLTAVFDIDLWQRRHSGRDEQFDADRFGEWLEALIEAGELVAARTIAALDEHLVIAGLSRYVRVFDPATLVAATGGDEPIDLPPFSGLSREVGGYVVRARRTDAWDAIVTLLFALAEHDPGRFHVVMGGCRRLSNSTPEIDGLDDLLTEPEQLIHDVAADRDQRRSEQGYVTAADARAFLEMARQRHSLARSPLSINPIVAAYFRAADDGARRAEQDRQRPLETPAFPDVDDRESVEAVAALLEDAGLMTERPRALLAEAAEDSSPPLRIEVLLRHLAETDDVAFAERSRELAFLANVLVAGSSVMSRAFTPQEAGAAALAICNLGLEHWPTADSFLADHDVVVPFEAGWAVLHELSLHVAGRLIDALAHLRCVDVEIQHGLRMLRRDLARHSENRTPWLARGSLEVITMIDMPVTIGLQALLGECPVLPDAVTAILEHRRGAISPTAFEFIASEREVRKVRDFAGTLLDLLVR